MAAAVMRIANQADAGTHALYRAGSISAIVVAVLYIGITGLYVATGLVPTDLEARLAYHQQNETAWWLIVWLSVFTDVLYVPVAAALVMALAPVNRFAALAGAGLVVLFVILDLAITWPNYAVLISLSADYAAATGEAQRGALLATAAYPKEVLDSSLLGAYIILTPGLGILLIGIVMLRSAFGRIVAWLGVLTGLSAIAAVFGGLVLNSLGTLAILAALLTTIWFFVVGIRLFRFGDGPGHGTTTRPPAP
jgi:hypothetical protein